MTTQVNVLLAGSGRVETMAAYDLEFGSIATITAVLRSNHQAVLRNGFDVILLNHERSRAGSQQLVKHPQSPRFHHPTGPVLKAIPTAELDDPHSNTQS